VSLILETVDGEMPALQTTSSGQLLRGPNGQPLVAGGWPCRHYPADWASRARQLLMAYGHARAQHTLCGKPEKAKENFARLRTYLAMCSNDPSAVTGRDVGMIRKILASYVTRHGAPGSDRLRETRARQAAMAARPMHHVLARVLADDRAGVYPSEVQGTSRDDPVSRAHCCSHVAPAGIDYGDTQITTRRLDDG
jgi:hypothetical protein